MKVKDIFKIKYGVNLELMRCEITSIDDKNSVNFVARTSQNNGVVARVKLIDNLTPQNAGTLSCATSGSVLSTFVQTEPYYSGRDLYVLTPKINLTIEQKLFYAMTINKNSYRYNYGRAANKTLPNIDLPNLDECNKIIGDSTVNQIKTVIKKDKIDFDTSNWKEFSIGSLFSLVNGIKYPAEYRENGNLPLVSTSAQNNGITDYIADRPEKYSNLLTVAYSGSVGATFYQQRKVYIGETVFGLIPKFEMTKNIALFLTTILNYYNLVYSYGRKIIGSKYINDVIKLPAINDKPDWQYMENYIKSLPYADKI